jgi:ParB/Sulfiredoxin domain
MTAPTIGRKRDLVWISPELIVPNDNNPRQAGAFMPDELVSLRRSIMSHGVLEPVIITPYKGDTYKLVEGERRWTSARLMEANPEKTDEELAAELGVSLGTFRDRRQVLSMGDGVVMQIGRGEIDYYAALRTDQVSKTLAKRRPDLTRRSAEKRQRGPGFSARRRNGKG